MVVVDASAILEVLLNRAVAPRMRQRLLREQQLHAPHLIDVEVMHVLRRYGRTGEVEFSRAVAAIDEHLQLPIERHAHVSFMNLVWAFRNNFTAYDAMYVALGITLSATLITADAPLARAASAYLPVEVFA